MAPSDMPASQASSHFPLEPIDGLTLYQLESARKKDLECKGTCLTGCPELDEQVLLGGFERGYVVGISAEDEEAGLVLGLQTVAHLLVKGRGDGIPPTARVISMLPASELLPTLRNVIEAQVEATASDVGDPRACVHECLGRISLSRIFDFEDLWDVLSDMGHTSPEPERQASPPLNNQGQTVREPTLVPDVFPPTIKLEIDDSDEEGSPLSSAAPSPPSTPPAATIPPLPSPPDPVQSPPDLILITHASRLIHALFDRRERAAANTLLQLLASRLAYLTRHTSGPLVLVLNATTAASSHGRGTAAARRLDPSLRSVFAPPAGPSEFGYAVGAGGGGGGGGRRSKPAWGLKFAQLVDVHLLVSRLPRGRGDAEAVVAAGGGEGEGEGVEGVRFVWAVEVLLDEVGVYEEGGGGRKRWRCRERRWGVVDVVEGRRVVDAFGVGAEERAEEKERRVERVRVAGGFGGLRV